MNSLKSIKRWFRSRGRTRTLKRAIDEELQFHIDQRTAAHIAAGMPPGAAARAARKQFGNLQRVREECRDRHRASFGEEALRDFRVGVRQLMKHPGFTAVAVLTLALGIGANTAIFSVVNAVLLRPLPYPEPGQLVQLLRGEQSNKPSPVIGSAPFVAVKSQSRLLARIAAYEGGEMSLTGDGPAERIVAGAVTEDFFPLLGVQPVLGRNFTREEDRPNGSKVVILGHGLWQGRFGGDPGVLGRTINLNKQSYVVVGILPAGFAYPEPFQLWTPLALGETAAASLPSSQRPNEGMGLRLVKAIARLKPGVTFSQAQAEMKTIAQHLQAGGPTATPRGEGAAGGTSVLTLAGLHEQVVGDVKGALLVLLGAVALVLLIACVNVANLLLARAAARQREMAVRVALGAGRWRIARELLTESVLLSLAGGALGLVVAFGGVRVLGRWSGASLPAMQGIGMDAWVLAFTLGVSLIAGLGFGLAPAVHAWRADANAALKEESRSDTGGHRDRLRQLLVVSEVAVALVLLVGAGLLLKSFSRLLDVPPGFRTEGVLTFQVTLAEGKSSAQKASFIERVVEGLKALPGVQAAAATDSLPLTGLSRIGVADVEGRPPIDFRTARREDVIPLSRPTVTADYFAAMGIPLKRGRTFMPEDARPTGGSVVVNESFANQYFPGESAIGQRIRLAAGPGKTARWQTVVGVVGDVRQSGSAGDILPEVYNPDLDDSGEAVSFVLHVAGEPAGIIPSVRGVVTEVDPSQSLYNVMTMAQRLANATTSRRLNTALLGGFAALALLLAVVGIYGVMSFAVTQRRREIGVRMALGARKCDVLGLIIRGGLRLTLLGVALGLVGALALTRYLSSQLYSVKATDPWTFLGVAVLLTGAALLACWLPARRAAKVEPMEALRSE